MSSAIQRHQHFLDINHIQLPSTHKKDERLLVHGIVEGETDHVTG